MIMRHRNVQPHVSIKWQRSLATDPERTLMGCADPPSKGGQSTSSVTVSSS